VTFPSAQASNPTSFPDGSRLRAASSRGFRE
jgi:hypothetical protein